MVISSSQKDILRLIQEATIPVKEKLCLSLMTLREEKQITLVCGEVNNTREQLEVWLATKQYENMLVLLRQLPFVYVGWDVVGVADATEPWKWFCKPFIIGKSYDAIEKFHLASRKVPFIGRCADEYTRGILIGYPESACRAFAEGTSMTYEQNSELKEAIDSLDLMPFIEMAFSPENWRAELEYCWENQRLIRDFVPSLYAELYKKTVS